MFITIHIKTTGTGSTLR